MVVLLTTLFLHYFEKKSVCNVCISKVMFRNKTENDHTSYMKLKIIISFIIELKFTNNYKHLNTVKNLNIYFVE